MDKNPNQHFFHEYEHELELKLNQAVVRIAKKLNKTSHFDTAIESLMSDFLNLIHADEGTIQLLRPDSKNTRCTAVRKGGEKQGVLDRRLDDFLTGRILYNKEGFRTNDLTSLFENVSLPKRYSEISSVLSVPIKKESEIIGSVNLVRFSEKFTERDFELASALAAQIGEFIDGVHLREQLFLENERLRINLGDRFAVHGILGQSASIRNVFTQLQQIIPTDARVVILGESGTGKELIAKCIHFAGPRKNKAFVAIDCGALPANLLESELFGYVKGAFTGAIRDRMGLIEQANHGTLFLDEITNMSLETQAKLLRFIQEGEIRPLGSNQNRKVDVRIIVAASTDLAEQVDQHAFRSDLFYRLNVITLKVPPLRDRIEDIPVLSQVFLNRFSKKHGKSIHTLSSPALQILEHYSWPGNIRELENVIERAVVMSHFSETSLSSGHFPEAIMNPDLPKEREEAFTGNLVSLMEHYECDILRKSLVSYEWNQSAAARSLNISEAVMRYKMKKFGIKPPSDILP